MSSAPDSARMAVVTQVVSTTTKYAPTDGKFTQ